MLLYYWYMTIAINNNHVYSNFMFASDFGSRYFLTIYDDFTLGNKKALIFLNMDKFQDFFYYMSGINFLAVFLFKTLILGL